MREPQGPELHAIRTLLDDSIPPQIAALAGPLREALYLGSEWISEFIAGPHHSRKGPLCPFMPKAIDLNRVLFGVEQAPCADVDMQKRCYQALAESYLGAPPPAGSKEALTSLLIVYPFEDAAAPASIVGQTVRELKNPFLEVRRMIGLFYVHWEDEGDGGRDEADGLRNPLSVLAMRHLAQGDDVFLKTSDSAMAIYRRHYPE